MTDNFASAADTVASPARRAVAITPDDDAPLAETPKALFVGIGGTIAMRGADDDADTLWRGVGDGAILPFRASHVRASGTTASGIVALL